MIYGIVLSLAASVCFNLNNLLEKRAVDQMAAFSAGRAGHMVRALLRSPLWLSGFVIGIVAVLLLTLAYSLVPIAVVQSIFGAGIVLLVPASRLYLGEHLGKREICGLAVVIAGIVLVSVTLGRSSTPVDSLSLVRVMVVSALTAATAGLLFLALRRTSTDPSIALGASCGLIYSIASIQSKSASILLEHQGIRHGVVRVLESPYPYAFVVASLLGLLSFQSGLQRVRITLAAPLVNVVGSAFTVGIGTLIFDEQMPTNSVLSVLRLGGFAIVLVGTWILATGKPASASTVVPSRHDSGSDASTGVATHSQRPTRIVPCADDVT